MDPRKSLPNAELVGVAHRALEPFGLGADAEVESFGRGLINRTFRVDVPRGAFVLQRLNPIFDPAIHHNIEAVTARLAAVGLATPRLVRTTDDRLWADLGADGIWRLMTLVPGVSFDAVQSTAQAHAAGALVGRFHRALATLEHTFVSPRAGVHDTTRHLELLRQAIASHVQHELHEVVSELGREILDAAERLPALPNAGAPWAGHGDLKLNNILFAGPGSARRDEAIALVDLDTVGPIALGHELGDAWRSWCNPAGEESPEAGFDLQIFEGAWRGYEGAAGSMLGPDERRGLLAGPEWVSLELAARFAADALRECYFGWDPDKHSSRGHHNLARARGQWAVHRAVVRCRSERARLLGVLDS